MANSRNIFKIAQNIPRLLFQQIKKVSISTCIQGKNTYRLVKNWLYKTPLRPSLASLAPNENIPENKYYANLLYEQVDKKFDNLSNRNIALTGEYGTGKSSIIRAFVKERKNEVVIISFATLNSTKQNDAVKKDIRPENDEANLSAIKTEDLPLYADTYGAADRTEANGIQKEIVKQLMFRERSNALPYSKFSRVGPPNVKNNLAISLLLVGISLIFLYRQILELSSKFVKHIPVFPWLEPEVFKIIVFSSIVAMLFLLVYYVTSTTIGRLILEKVGSSSLSVSFASSKNYFDDYLDEIIYLFESKKYEIIVFEDLDRFHNLLIFERLRALNKALNDARSLSKRPIRFIYAVRDSLFDNDGIDDAGISRAKFFDVIIPVVPFLTFENSLKHFKDNLPEEKSLSVSDHVLQIAARYITDMRLIYDICNEYKVFAEQLNIEKSTLRLRTDNLFAMIVFKNMYPSEFGKLKYHDNMLSQLISRHADIKRSRIDDIQKTIESSLDELKSHSTINDKVNAYSLSTKYMLDTLGQDDQYFTHIVCDEEDNEVDEDYIDKDFWDKLQNKKAEDPVFKLKWSHTSYPHNSSFSHTIIVTRAMLEAHIGEAINLNELEKTEAEKINQQVSRNKSLIEELRYASVKSHIEIENRNELKGSVEDCLPKDMDPLPILIKEGYIDDYYLQYFSTYKGALSRDALYYRHEYIERGLYDEQYYLSDKDLGELMKSLDAAYATGPGMFNASILGYLIHRNDKKMIPGVISLLANNEQAVTNICIELVRRKRTIELKTLIGLLSSSGYLSIFNSIVSLGNISDKTRLSLLNAAIENASTSHKYLFGEEAELYIVNNLKRITALSKSTAKPVSKHLEAGIAVLKQITHRILLGEINDNAREKIIANNLYQITNDNLEIIVKNLDFSMDNILFKVENGATIFQYLLNNLDEYLITLKTSSAKQHSIKGLEGFEEIINKVFTEKRELFDEFIELADTSNCIVEDINSLDKGVWAHVMDGEHVTVQSSFQNVLDYYLYSKPEEAKLLDKHLASYLNLINGEVNLDNAYEAYEETARDELLRDVLNSPSVNVDSKVNYVANMFAGRGKTLNVSFFNLQNGELYGKLLSQGLIADTAKSYGIIQNQDWKTRKAYLSVSKDATTYIGDIVTINDINHILSDLTLSEPIRIVAAKKYTQEMGDIEHDAAEQYAKLIINKKIPLDVKTVEYITEKISSETLVRVINSMPNDISQETLKSIFARSSHSELRKISSNTRKRISIEDTEANRKLLDRLMSQNIIRSYGHSWWGTGLAAWVVE